MGKKKKFKRQEKHKFKRLKDSWRRPRGKDSKMRKDKKGKLPRVKVGYRKPRAERGLHPSGFREVLVENPRDIEKINSETQAARISSTVGARKRGQIITRARELGVKILNVRKSEIGGRESEPEHAEETSS